VYIRPRRLDLDLDETSKPINSPDDQLDPRSILDYMRPKPENHGLALWTSKNKFVGTGMLRHYRI
jgi:hypothetical protein